MGDRVLAPWEPTFLYAGTLDPVHAARALIQFDDGDCGWVDLAHLRPLTLRPGQRVMSRRRMGPHFFPDQIRSVHGEKVDVEFDDGKAERTTVAALRIPCAPLGRGAELVSAISHTAFHKRLKEGDRVWALWNHSALFPGTVAGLRDREAHVEFDDGDQAWVQLDHLLPLDLVVNTFVMARRRGESEFLPATISDTEGERVQVRFDDGAEEWTTPAALALPVQAPPPSAATTPPASAAPIRQGWSPSLVMLFGGTLLVAVAAFFYWLGHR
jgi:hypothetical protein